MQILDGSVIHRGPLKKVPLLFLRLLWQMWTDFNNSFTFGFVVKLRNAVKQNLPPQLNYVAALPCEI